MSETRKGAARTRANRGEALKKGLSFGALCEAWYTSEILGGGVAKPENIRGVLDRHLLPKIGVKAASDVTGKDITRFLDGVKREFPSTANQMLRICRRVYTFGVRRGVVTSNPAFDLSIGKDAGGTVRERTRALSVDELVRLFAAFRETPGLSSENLLAFKLLLALGLRKGELLAARWEEFDLKGRTAQGPVWHLPGDRATNGEPLDIPLVPVVPGWLERLRGLADQSEWVFPRRRVSGKSLTPHVAGQTLNAALARVGHGLEHFTVEDLRRTTRVQLAALGIRREVVEKCLGLMVRGVDGGTDLNDYYKERRLALAQWAEVLVEAEEGSAKRVRRAKA